MSAQATHFADDATLARISQLERENWELRKALKLLVQHCPTTFTFPNDAELQRAEVAAENLLIELGEL